MPPESPPSVSSAPSALLAAPSVTPGRAGGRLVLAFWLLLLVLAALRPLAVPDEGRYGEIGRWMWQSGDWLAPRLNGIPFFHKPPYLYWLEALSVGLLGASAWALRLVPALHAGLMLGSLYWACRQALGERVARLAVLMLGSSLAFLLGGQYVNHDMLVAAWIGVAIWSFALAFAQAQGPQQRPHAQLARWGFVACAMGVLSKGLIGLALPGLVLLIWLTWTRQLNKIARLPWFSGLLLFALLALPWFVLAEQRFPGMLDYLVGTQQVTRFTGTGFNNARPWWFYGLCLLLLLFPWSLLAPLAWRARPAPLAPAAPASDASALAAGATPAHPALWRRLCLVWLLAIVGFFSIPQSKLIGYILPVMPPLAVLSALGFEARWGRHRRRRQLLAGLLLLALLAAVAAQGLALRWTEQHGARDVALVLAAQVEPGRNADLAAEAPILVLGDQYPYDLPFYARLRQPLVLVQDWPELARSAGDNWARELFEGARFDPVAARVLQGPEALAPNHTLQRPWVLAPRSLNPQALPAGLDTVHQGLAWTLYRQGVHPPP